MLIQQAVDLIAEFDPAAARVFATQPFNRVGIAKVFRAGFRRHTAYSEAVCELVEKTARLDQLDREA